MEKTKDVNLIGAAFAAAVVILFIYAGFRAASTGWEAGK